MAHSPHVPTNHINIFNLKRNKISVRTFIAFFDTFLVLVTLFALLGKCYNYFNLIKIYIA